MKGLFITLEGGEGSGKTTIAKRLAKRLTDEAYDVVVTREPGGIPIAEKIREVILNPQHMEMDYRTEALLYAAARRQHLMEKVIPALEAGKVVICDRFIDSSVVYQGVARGLGMDDIWEINQFATGGLLPDLTLFFDIAPHEGLARINKDRSRHVDRLDLEGMAFHEMVYEGYLQQMKLHPARIKPVNALASIEAVEAAVYEKVKEKIIHG